MERRQRMVDLVGIEPTTSSMPWKRAPSCATGPRTHFSGRLAAPFGAFDRWLGMTTSIFAQLSRCVKLIYDMGRKNVEES